MKQSLNTELTHPSNELKLTGCITLIEQKYWCFVVFLQHKTGEIIINTSYNYIMTKEEKIQSEWDKLTPNSQLNICKNTGFVITYCINGIDDLIDNSIIKESDVEFEYLESDLIRWRPKSLSGIENNRGWIKIESEEDLPEHGYYEVIQIKNGINSRATLDKDFNTKSQTKNYSHYQKIKELPNPIY